VRFLLLYQLKQLEHVPRQGAHSTWLRRRRCPRRLLRPFPRSLALMFRRR
jgi:hypothetical protein